MRSLVKRLGMGLPNNLLPEFPAITGSLIDRSDVFKMTFVENHAKIAGLVQITKLGMFVCEHCVGTAANNVPLNALTKSLSQTIEDAVYQTVLHNWPKDFIQGSDPWPPLRTRSTRHVYLVDAPHLPGRRATCTWPTHRTQGPKPEVNLTARAAGDRTTVKKYKCWLLATVL
jgi:hypothetical protein